MTASWYFCLMTCDMSTICLMICDRWWFSWSIPVLLTNKTDYYDITEISLKVPLNTNVLYSTQCLTFIWYYDADSIFYPNCLRLYDQVNIINVENGNWKNIYLYFCATSQVPYKSYTIDWLIDCFVFNFQQYFSYIIATSFSGGRSRRIQRAPPTMC